MVHIFGTKIQPVKIMDLVVTGRHSAVWNGREMRCDTGGNGFVPASKKKEGDRKTPIGPWIMREIFYRSDRIEKPVTTFPIREIRPEDGWCDDPADRNYNRYVKLPYAASHENLCRDDELYDIVVVLGYNDAPPVPGKGSAIFLHIAREDFSGTAGCVGLKKEDLLSVLREAKLGSAVVVQPAP